MNFLQTLYIDPNKDPFRDTFGWAAPEYHLMAWALSCMQLHQMHGKISLYGNSPAARLLIDTLQLPYTKVLVIKKAIQKHRDAYARGTVRITPEQLMDDVPPPCILHYASLRS